MLVQEFEPKWVSTLGVNNCTVIMYFKDQNTVYEIVFNFFDFAGQDKFSHISSRILRKCNGCFIMYDQNSPITLNGTSMYPRSGIKGWYRTFHKKNQKAPIVIIGNKCELQSKVRSVDIKQKGKKVPHIKISVKERINMCVPLLKMVQTVFNNNQIKIKN